MCACARECVCCSQLSLRSVRQPQQQRHAHRLTSCCHAAASTGQPTQVGWAFMIWGLGCSNTSTGSPAAASTGQPRHASWAPLLTLLVFELLRHAYLGLVDVLLICWCIFSGAGCRRTFTGLVCMPSQTCCLLHSVQQPASFRTSPPPPPSSALPSLLGVDPFSFVEL